MFFNTHLYSFIIFGMQGLTSVCEFSAIRHFFKTKQNLVKKHEMWSFSIKFGELRHKNVNNTFMIKRKFTSKGSQPHTRLATLEVCMFFTQNYMQPLKNTALQLCLSLRDNLSIQRKNEGKKLDNALLIYQGNCIKNASLSFRSHCGCRQCY